MQPTTSSRILVFYYAATALFLVLDFGFSLNVRVAFLAGDTGWRLAYYGVCFACLGLMIWRPAWTAIVGAIESLTSMIALIMHMAMRSMIVTDAMIETGSGFVTNSEIVNFVISGSAAYFAWNRNMTHLFGRRP